MMIGAILLVAGRAAASEPVHATVSWSEIRSAVGRLICVTPEGRAPQGYTVAVGRRAECGAPDPVTDLDKAVDSAFEETQPLLVSIPPVFDAEPKGLPAAYALEEPGARDGIAREIYLKDENFLKAIVPRLKTALAVRGLACEDCPSIDPRPVRELKWSDFAPYVSAFVLPDPVRTPVGADGKPAGRPRYSFHICSGLAELSPLKDPDPLLQRAGFTAAMSAPGIRNRAGSHFGEILGSDTFGHLETDEDRTKYLRAEMDRMLQADPEVRAGSCDVIRKYGADLGLKLTDCPTGP